MRRSERSSSGGERELREFLPIPGLAPLSPAHPVAMQSTLAIHEALLQANVPAPAARRVAEALESDMTTLFGIAGAAVTMLR